MTTAILLSDEALPIYGCLFFVAFVAFGDTVCKKLSSLNKKHHIISWDNDTIYSTDDDDN